MAIYLAVYEMDREPVVEDILHYLSLVPEFHGKMFEGEISTFNILHTGMYSGRFFADRDFYQTSDYLYILIIMPITSNEDPRIQDELWMKRFRNEVCGIATYWAKELEGSDAIVLEETGATVIVKVKIAGSKLIDLLADIKRSNFKLIDGGE